MGKTKKAVVRRRRKGNVGSCNHQSQPEVVRDDREAQPEAVGDDCEAQSEAVGERSIIVADDHEAHEADREDVIGADDSGNEGNETDPEAVIGESDSDNENDGSHFGLEEQGSVELVEYVGDVMRNDSVENDDESGDDTWDDEKIHDPLSSSDDDTEVIEPRQNEDPEELLALGKMYGSGEDFKLALLRYSLKTSYDIKMYKSTSLRLGARCSDSKCPWSVYCSYEKRKQKLQIKVYVNEHICVRSGYSKLLKRSTIAWLFAERLRVNPKMTSVEMAAEIKREYNLLVTIEQCRKAKTKLAKERKASHEAQFARIWDYQAEVFRSNKDSIMEIETLPGPTIGSKQRFYRLFVCFKSQRDTWKESCRPIIGLDGAFLKWDIKGHLLAAVGRDGDNRIVPIAWAVVEIENDTNWDWFVRHLNTTLGLNGGRNMAIISDKQKGLVKAVHNILPEAEHRMCARHIVENWRKDSDDIDLKRLFWRIARSYTIGEFEDNMEALRQYSPSAHESLQHTSPKTWSRAYFRIGTCCNDILNNLSESFNRTIREARRKPLLDMLEDIRRQCMVRNAERAIIANRLKTRFTKKVHVEIAKMIDNSMACTRYMATNEFYEIEHQHVNYTVDMGSETCSCRKWQMTGIPCIHAACVIISKKEKVEDYVSHYYTKETWEKTYSQGIKPVQGMKFWPRTNRLPVLPPPSRLGNPGRPSVYARRKGRNEIAVSSKTKLTRLNRVITCSNCKEEGHNKARCSNPSVENPPKRPRGRPRKDQGGSYECFSQEQGSQAQGSQVQDSQAQRSQTQEN